MGDLDIAAKALLREEPGAFVRLAIPGREIRSIAPDETDLHALERRMDKLLRVEVTGEDDPIWIHVEVEAVWASDVPGRVFDYWSLVHMTRPRVRSLVIVLRPGDRQGDPKGDYEVSVLEDRVLSFGFDVICAWKLEAKDLLEGADPGLLPLIPFTRGATPRSVVDAFRILESKPSRHIGELQTVLAAFSSQVFPRVNWLGKLREVVRMPNAAVQYYLTEGNLRIIARQLRVRLGKSKRTAAIVARLPDCNEKTLVKIADLVVGGKKKPQLFSAIEKLVPETAEKK